jgi:hypothetical protein
VQPNASAHPRVKRIALIAIDGLDPDALCYTLNACQRLDACLDILTNLPHRETDRAVVGMRGKTDTPWRIIRVDAESGDHIFRYARDESGLLFLASAAGDEKALGFRNSAGRNGPRSGISWVVVESKRTGPGPDPVKQLE